ncbi:MAG: hypothetical protein CL526_02900 [Aequorivita sp.]|nr:hypothetical protein [Aequorivita sp.]
MGSKLYRLFEYLYLVAAAFFAYETVVHWNTARNQAYLYLFFVVIAIFMFFFKRSFRKKMNNRK